MEIEMILLQCATCGMPFCISADKQERLRKCHNDFYCPDGHINVYSGKTKEEKLREELREKEAALELLRQRENERIAAENAKRDKRKAKAKKK